LVEYNLNNKSLDVEYRPTDGKSFVEKQEVDKNWFYLKFLKDYDRGAKFLLNEVANAKCKCIEYFENFPELKKDEKLCIECYKPCANGFLSFFTKNQYNYEVSPGIVLCSVCEVRLSDKYERIERERIEKKIAEKESTENQNFKKESEKDRNERERNEKEREEREKETKERERIEKEKIEKERFEKETKEKETKEKEKNWKRENW